MILDKLSEFCDNETLDTTVAVTLLGNVINSKAARNHGAGRQLFLNIRIPVAVTSVGAPTTKFSLVSDAQAAIAVDGSATVHFETPDMLKAVLDTDFAFSIPLPLEGSTPYEQYLGILQENKVTTLTAGAADVFLTLDTPAWKAFAEGQLY